MTVLEKTKQYEQTIKPKVKMKQIKISLSGSIIYNQTVTSQTVHISLNDFGTKGMYIAQILDENQVVLDSKKIVLE